MRSTLTLTPLMWGLLSLPLSDQPAPPTPIPVEPAPPLILVEPTPTSPRAVDEAPQEAPLPDNAGCVACHRAHHPQIVEAWAKARCGGARVGCEDCHGVDHDQMFRQEGRVSPKVCARCHPQQAAQIAEGAHTHSIHDDPQYQALSPSERAATCDACHRIGRVFEDGGQGDCAACHADHAFSKARARRPEACLTCHTGAEHPEFEAWTASRHGVAYQTGDAHAPGCVACHLKDHRLVPLSLGGGLFGAALAGEIGAQLKGAGSRGRPLALQQGTLTRADFEARRAEMVAICRDCHSARFAKRHLQEADAAKRRTDEIIAEAAQLIWALHEEGRLDPMPADRPPVPGHGHALVMGAVRGGVSRIEQLFFRLARVERAKVFKGAYHSAPHQTHGGLLEMELSLGEMRQEAKRLRAQGNVIELNE